MKMHLLKIHILLSYLSIRVDDARWYTSCILIKAIVLLLDDDCMHKYACLPLSISIHFSLVNMNRKMHMMRRNIIAFFFPDLVIQ